MLGRLVRPLILCLAVFTLFWSSLPVRAAPPAGFQNLPIVTSGLTGPTAFAFAPDGRIFILQRTGEVKIYKNGSLLAQNFVTLPSLTSGDRGLIGIAFDPDFSVNHYVYFYHTYTDSHNRLVRYSAAADTAADGPVIIYETPQLSFQLHVGGGLAFGPDGKIYLAVGDNGTPGNAQDLSNPYGKVLRLNKDGSIPADNPFIGQSGSDPYIWALGLRNPWRLQFDTLSPFRLYLSDVGANSWEEINVIAKGANYGWPVCEGTCSTAGLINPLFAYPHNGASRSVTGGPVYRAGQFPVSYQGQYFFGDYAAGFIRTLELDSSGALVADHDFDLSAGSVVDLRTASDGSLYYLTFYPGRLYRISYSPDNQYPVASAGSNVNKGLPPLTVNFTSAGSFDPEGQPLSYLWDFGDGTTGTSADPSHTYSAAGTYLVELTVSDGSYSTPAVPLVIQVGVSPAVTIGTPQDGSLYRAGDTITYSVSATDGAGFDINDNNISVEVLFHHGTHLHPFLGPLTGRNGSFTIPVTGEPDADQSYEIIATATDDSGLSSTDTVSIFPQTVDLTFATNPSGLQLLLDDIPLSTPQTITHVVNFSRRLTAPSPQVQASQVYEFSSWSDTGAQTHTISAPATPATYTAAFQPVSGKFIGQYWNFTWTGSSPQIPATTPNLTRSDSTIDFNWARSSPATSVNVDDFVVSWSGNFDFAASGTYRFTTTADDGVRLFVDNQLVIDKWKLQSATTYTADVALSAGSHLLRLEYFEHGWDAVAGLSWAPAATPTATPTPTPTPAPPAGGFTGQYFANRTLSGSPVLARADPVINFNWGRSAPDPAVPADDFSVRWTGSFDFPAANYTFTATADDGVRLYVDDNLVLDKWINQSATTYQVSRQLTAGVHILRMEYYERGWDAVARLSWVQSVTPTPTPAPPPPGTSFTGQYWNFTWTGSSPSIPATTPSLTRTDPAVDFNWGRSSPATSVNVDDFVVRWSGNFDFTTAGNYRFTTTADDGVRLFVDNQLVIDKWKLQSAATYTADVSLTAGSHLIRLEYFEHGWDAVARLSWQPI